MNIHNVTGVERTLPPAAARRPHGDPPSEGSAESSSPAAVDSVTQQPVPPRFPWLSWVTARLEPASRQPAPYGSAPPLGENVDQHA